MCLGGFVLSRVLAPLQGVVFYLQVTSPVGPLLELRVTLLLTPRGPAVVPLTAVGHVKATGDGPQCPFWWCL